MSLITQGVLKGEGIILSINGGIVLEKYGLADRNVMSNANGTLVAMEDLSSQYRVLKFTLQNTQAQDGNTSEAFLDALKSKKGINLVFEYSNADKGIQESLNGGVLQGKIPELRDNEQNYGEIEIRFPAI